ncbi:MAG: ferredoxin [Planctomycetes bacterium GWF2_42_9]|nr:MAG: ferredoxin [Planctomycetes bacterium GWF2_42_9]HAL45489.1 ferredoxin [Phycisphaerales bacterium]
MPTVNEHCNKCGQCVDACPAGAIQITEDQVIIDADNCVECGFCIDECPQKAIEE